MFVIRYLNIFLVNVLIFFIKVYSIIISPLIGKNCRFEPTCSRYAIDSIKIHGIIRGGFLTIRRILKCRPFGGYGVDPVPRRDNF